jgi:hypothetical protein
MGLSSPLEFAPVDGLIPTSPPPLTPPERTGVVKTGEDAPCTRERERVDIIGGGRGIDAKDEGWEPSRRE